MFFVEEFQAIPYPPKISIVTCNDINEARKGLELKLYDKSDWDKGTIGYYYIHTVKKNRSVWRPFMFINVSKHENFSDLVDTIVHEADHIANQVLQYSGVEITYNNDEAHTYLQGYIVQKALQHFFTYQEQLGLKEEIVRIDKK